MTDIQEFPFIWDNIIVPLRQVMLEECDSAMVENCGLHYRDGNEWRRELEKEFHIQRQDLKRQCYNRRKQQLGPQPLLDPRKVAAILCKTCLKRKAFSFDVTAATSLAAEKKKRLSDPKYTVWSVHNILVNYKFAHLVGTQLVYLTLLSDLLHMDETKKMGLALNEMGHLLQYPAEFDYDTFDMNVIIGMARGDVGGKNLNALLYAMQLYQLEMYTRERLKNMAEEVQLPQIE